MSTKGSSPFALHPDDSNRSGSGHGLNPNVPQPNVLEFGRLQSQPSPVHRDTAHFAAHAPYEQAQALATQPAHLPSPEKEFETAWSTAEAPFPLPEPHAHPHLDQPLEPLSDRLDRLGSHSELELIHSKMLDRYAEAEAEQTEQAETDWYASRIAGAHSWASMENSLDSLISDYEKRHHRANIYVAGGIGGAVVLTLIALSAFLMLGG